MIITMSPAKLMDFDKKIPFDLKTTPLFINEADELIAELENFSVEEIKKLMDINFKLAMDTFQYIKAYHISRTPLKQAIYAFNGMAYLGLDAKTFSKDDIEYAQQHLVILSGLYGALQPMDMIKPYRLVMHAALENSSGKNLYTFWSEKLTKYLLERLNGDDKTWINLASAEYTKVIDKKKLPDNIQIITPVFKQQTATGYKQIVVYTKKARGMMVRFIIQNRISNAENLKLFDTEGYSFSEELSKKSEWVFIR